MKKSISKWVKELQEFIVNQKNGDDEKYM